MGTQELGTQMVRTHGAVTWMKINSCVGDGSNGEKSRTMVPIRVCK